MKKILLATTALVATTGYAAADDNLNVAITGRAEVGIVGGTNYGDVTQFHTDVDIDFDMSGEADNGLTFGASVDLDEAATTTFPNNDDAGVSYFVAYGDARADFGDVDGAFDAALTEVAIAGTIDDTETTHDGYNGNAGLDGTYDGQIATFSYAFSGFTGYLSAEIDDTGTGDPVWGIGVKYAADISNATVGVGLGYQQTDVNGGAAGGSQSIWGISLNTTFNNGIQAIANYSEQDRDAWAANQTHWALGLGYSMNALTIGLNYGQYDDLAGVSGDEASGYALSVNYDLGGGLVAQAGYHDGETTVGGVTTDEDQWSLGLSMTF